MTRFIGLALTLLAAGCSAPNIGDIPPVSIGGGGAHLMTNPRSTDEAYDNAYSSLTSYHNQIRSFLAFRPPNTYGATRSLEQIAEALQTMQSLIAEPKKSALQPYIEWYRQAKRNVEGNRYGGSFENELGRLQQELRSGFKLDAVEIVAEAPGKTPEKPAGDPSAGGGTPTKPDGVKPMPSDVPVWMLFNAWRQSHADLVEVFTKKAEAGRAYRRVREAVSALKARLPDERQKKLALAEATYEQQNEETKGFTAAPPGGKDEDVLRVLKLVGDMIDAEYNPDKK